ncbi:MAG: hypothetical protein IT381_31265 [Deltaproteobacteria bacterium]|nr:hypothetical protein [Deltaproteobacteria bacterium]
MMKIGSPPPGQVAPPPDAAGAVRAPATQATRAARASVSDGVDATKVADKQAIDVTLLLSRPADAPPPTGFDLTLDPTATQGRMGVALQMRKFSQETRAARELDDPQALSEAADRMLALAAAYVPRIRAALAQAGVDPETAENMRDLEKDLRVAASVAKDGKEQAGIMRFATAMNELHSRES